MNLGLGVEKTMTTMKRTYQGRTHQGLAIALIALAFFSGVVVTAITSGCDAKRNPPYATTQPLHFSHTASIHDENRP